MARENRNSEPTGNRQPVAEGDITMATAADTTKQEQSNTAGNSRKTRKEKKLIRKQMQAELRRKKKEAFQCKSFIGKVAHVLGGFVKALFMIGALVTIIRINYMDIFAIGKMAGLIVNRLQTSAVEVTQEKLYDMVPLDEERGALIDGSEPIGEDETWAVYLYMVGSDLEASKTNQLSDVVEYLALKEATPLEEARRELDKKGLNTMVDTILANDLELPGAMYARTLAADPITNFASQVDQHLYKMVAGGDTRAASADINEIMAVTLPENVKVVIQPGGALSWGHNMINPNRTQRFLYDANGMQLVYDAHISNMGHPDTLTDFLTFCETEYPADHTMVLFWNHGGASFGYGYDSVFGDDFLSLEELRSAFEQVYTPDEKNPPVDIIGFDACLMASMEVAHTFHGFGSYLLGSEDVEPGDGWDYTAWLGALAENPRMNAQQVGKAVADSYIEYYGKEAAAAGSGTELFSMLDLSYADDLYNAYVDFANDALRESVTNAGTAAALGKAANSSIKYCGNDIDVYNTVDLGLFMKSIDGPLQSKSQKVLDVIDDMVIYNRACKNVEDSMGITVYYPATVDSLSSLLFATRYINQICTDPSVQALYFYKVAGCLPEEMQQHVALMGYGELLPMDTKPLHQMEQAEFELQENGNFVMAFAENARSLTQEYRYNLMQVKEDGTVLYLGYDDYLAVNSNGELVSEYDGKWARIDGQLLPTQVISTNGSTLRYSAQIMYNGNAANLLLSYDQQTGENKILGVQLISDSSDYDVLADRQNLQLKSGDMIMPVYEAYDINTGIGRPVHGKSIIYSDDIKVVDEPVPNGTYMSYVTLVDARGDLYDMRLVSFEVDNGVISNAAMAEGF